MTAEATAPAKASPDDPSSGGAGPAAPNGSETSGSEANCSNRYGSLAEGKIVVGHAGLAPSAGVPSIAGVDDRCSISQ